MAPEAANGQEIVLREALAADLPVLHALDQLCFAPGIAYSHAEFRVLLNHPSSYAIAATQGSVILGFAIVQTTRRALVRTRRHQPALHLVTIDVDPKARRQRVGSRLMDWVLHHAQTLQLADVVLEVSVENVEAQAFYARYGFQVSGVVPSYYGPNLDAYLMERSQRR